MRKTYYFHDQKTEKILDLILKKEKASKKYTPRKSKEMEKIKN